jgi:hypothetical protein
MWKYHKETLCVAYHKQTKMPFSLSFLFFFVTKSENRRTEQILPRMIGTSGRGEEMRKGCGRLNIV